MRKSRGGNWSAQFCFFLPETSPRTSTRQINLSDNRLHQKPPEREQLAKENQYIIEQLAAPEVPVRRSGLQELLTSFLLQDLYLLFPHSSFCSSSSDNLVDLHSAVEWMHFPFFFFFLFPHVCVCVCLFSSSHCKFKQRQEDWLVIVTCVCVTGG